jgi:hypothetical protein
MLVKILLVAVIIVLLRNRLGIFRFLWPEFVGLAVGAMVGWWWATFLANSGVRFEAIENMGCPNSFIRPGFVLIGALAAVKPISAAIRGLFPPG